MAFPLYLSSSRSSQAVLGIFATCALFACLSVEGLERQLPPHLEARSSFNPDELNINRSDFTKDFVFGTATCALQIEGTTRDGGRGPSIFDHLNPTDPGIDSYRRYKEDVMHVKDLGVDSYRFSLSWTRILPNGSLSGGINQEGINHYNSLIDELIKNGIKPFVTIFHFDSPQALQEKYNGPLSREFVKDFEDYAEICFKTFGDRVKNWITINEPLIVAKTGYDMGNSPPNRCSISKSCRAGNSTTEPYIVSHNLLLAHATAVRLYREKFQPNQRGQIGISLVGQYAEPYSNSLADLAAAKRLLDFDLGWYMEPLVYGHYPKIMRKIVKDRLPTFTAEETKLVKGSFDFIGINYYTARYAKSSPIDLKALRISSGSDLFIHISAEKNGVPIGPKADGSFFIYIYPQGLEKLLLFMNKLYRNPRIYITENGVTEGQQISMKLAVNDQHRIEFISRHLYHVRQAIQKGANVQGYFVWSVFDDYEKYGLYYVDYGKNFTRIPKHSATWFHGFLKGTENQSSRIV